MAHGWSVPCFAATMDGVAICITWPSCPSIEAVAWDGRWSKGALRRWQRMGILKCNIFLYADNEPGERFWRQCGWSARSDLKVLQRETFPQGLRMIDYQLEPDLSVEEFIDVLVRSTLAERRPVDDLPTIAKMLAHADILVTARQGGRLVGVSRAISDFSYCTYLSDLAVDDAFQGRGIGRELIRRTHEAAGLVTMLVLLAAPKAQTYYPHVGMTKHESCWIIPRQVPCNKG